MFERELPKPLPVFLEPVPTQFEPKLTPALLRAYVRCEPLKGQIRRYRLIGQGGLTGTLVYEEE